MYVFGCTHALKMIKWLPFKDACVGNEHGGLYWWGKSCGRCAPRFVCVESKLQYAVLCSGKMGHKQVLTFSKTSGPSHAILMHCVAVGSHILLKYFCGLPSCWKWQIWQKLVVDSYHFKTDEAVGSYFITLWFICMVWYS